MTQSDRWAIFFAGLVAIRFHPKNEAAMRAPDQEVRDAAVVADLMLAAHAKRFGAAE